MIIIPNNTLHLFYDSDLDLKPRLIHYEQDVKLETRLLEEIIKFWIILKNSNTNTKINLITLKTVAGPNIVFNKNYEKEDFSEDRNEIRYKNEKIIENKYNVNCNNLYIPCFLMPIQDFKRSFVINYYFFETLLRRR